jgi:colicin import membrane protein
MLERNHLLPFSQPKKLDKDLYQNFIQVDVVALPDQLISDKTKPDTTLPIVDKPQSSKEEVKPDKEDPVLEAKEEAAKAKAEMEAKRQADIKKKEEIKATQEKKRKAEQEKALKRLQQEADREAALKTLAKNQDGKKGRQKLAGNILSKGTAATGKVGTAKDQYTALVAKAISDHFNYFPWQKKKNLVAYVYLEIYKTGRLKFRKVVKGSVDPTFDSAVLQAVDESQPLPVPEDLSVISDGITIEFKPE